MSGWAMRVRGLRKASGAVRAADGVSVNVEQGEAFALPGPGGAGKVTTIAVLSCLLHPDGGDAAVLGDSICRDLACTLPRWASASRAWRLPACA